MALSSLPKRRRDPEERSEERTPSYAWIIGGVSALVGLTALGLSRFAYALLLPLMRDSFGLHSTGAGLLSSANLCGFLAGALAGEDLGAYDVVVVALPAPQAVALLGEVPHLAARVASVKIAGCWAVMLAFEQSLALPFDGAFVQASALSWIARNNSKPGRSDAECWVLHGAPAWSDEHSDATPEQVIAWLSDAFRRATRCQGVKPIFAAAHRWRYALPTVLLEEACLFDPTLAIGACGDWCAGPRVEGAFLSGLTLTDHILFKGS